VRYAAGAIVPVQTPRGRQAPGRMRDDGTRQAGACGMGRADQDGLCGEAKPRESRFYSEFAGILQVKIRLRVSDVCMLITIFGEGSMR
jgi:hypothetical protein